MPPFFVDWLRSLTDEQAEKMWEFLDNQMGLEDAIEIIAVSHPEVATKLCGPQEPEKI